MSHHNDQRQTWARQPISPQDALATVFTMFIHPWTLCPISIQRYPCLWTLSSISLSCCSWCLKVPSMVLLWLGKTSCESRWACFERLFHESFSAACLSSDSGDSIWREAMSSIPILPWNLLVLRLKDTRVPSMRKDQRLTELGPKPSNSFCPWTTVMFHASNLKQWSWNVSPFSCQAIPSS